MFRQVAPAVVYDVTALLGISRINDVSNRSQFLAGTCIILVYGVTVGQGSIAWRQLVFTTALPFDTVAGRQGNRLAFVFIEDDADFFPP